MARFTVHADGSITEGAAVSKLRIVGTSPRELAQGGRRLIDVTHVWHSPRLAEIIETLIDSDGSDLPVGFHFRERRDGFPMVGVDQ